MGRGREDTVHRGKTLRNECRNILDRASLDGQQQIIRARHQVNVLYLVITEKTLGKFIKAFLKLRRDLQFDQRDDAGFGNRVPVDDRAITADDAALFVFLDLGGDIILRLAQHHRKLSSCQG